MGLLKINCARVGMIGTNCYLISDEDSKEAIIVDPGDNAAFIERGVESLGIRPVAIFLTHAHYDHIGALPEIKEKYQVPVYIHEGDVPMLADRRLNMGNVEMKLAADDVVLHGEEELETAGHRIKVIHTPGHTPGGVCYYFPDDSILISGDTLFRFSWGRSDFPGGDEAALMASIRQKLLPLPEDTMVFPGHEGATRIGDERKLHCYSE